MTVQKRLRDLERVHAQHLVPLRDAIECAKLILQAVKLHCPAESIAAVRRDVIAALDNLTLKRLR